MSSATPTSYSVSSCAHERGPGTSVCLRCRAEAHASAAGRRRRLLAQLAIVAVVAAVGVGIAEGAITARHGTVGAASAAARATVVAQGEPVPTPAVHRVAAGAAAPQPKTPAAGRTELGAGLYVDHDAGETRVHFDTERTRTRRRDKFEAIVRQTLPTVYGARADSILAALPEGEMVREGDLLEELPRSGIHLPPRAGWSITLWPETRPGRDGPLVVSYRVVINPAD